MFWCGEEAPVVDPRTRLRPARNDATGRFWSDARHAIPKVGDLADVFDGDVGRRDEGKALNILWLFKM